MKECESKLVTEKAIQDTRKKTLRKLIEDNAEEGAGVFTDGLKSNSRDLEMS